MKRALTAAVMAITLVFCVPSYAAQPAEAESPASAAAYDVLLMRPFGALSVVFGTAAFIIGLPVTLTIGAAGDSADELVAGPFNFTFRRPVGDLTVREYQDY